MTTDDIIRMARECGWKTGTAYDDCRQCSNFDPMRFARLIAAAEREACAAICDKKVEAEYATGKVDHNEMGWTQSCAIAIRKRDAL